VAEQLVGAVDEVNDHALANSTQVRDERSSPTALLCDHLPMPTATITIDGALKARLADLARQTGQDVDTFVEALLRRMADADIRFEHGVPVFPPRPGAPVLTVEDVDRLANDEA
jgi:hypothetical protein